MLTILPAAPVVVRQTKNRGQQQWWNTKLTQTKQGIREELYTRTDPQALPFRLGYVTER